MPKKNVNDASCTEGKENVLFSYDVLVSLFLSLFILSFVGVGNIFVVGTLGLLLCMMGLMQKETKVDLWIFIPFMLYLLVGLVSSSKANAGSAQGYERTQAIFLLVYLLLACLEEKEQFYLRQLCVLWTGIVAVTGIGQFVVQALAGSAGRLGWIMSNPNSLGIFLVLGWLALPGLSAQEKEHPKITLLRHIEPFLLIAAALTLSMESFLSMAVGLFLLFFEKKRTASLKETFFYACRMLAKPVLGIGIGLLIYLTADRTDVPWLCLPLLLYALAVSLLWRKFENFLEEYPVMAVIIAAAGLFVAATAILLRPNAAATFSERLEMMRNGLGYIQKAPLLGVGPYQWRALNLYDSDKYFNTWFIHNTFIHIGAELGIIAAALLIATIIRFFQKKKSPAQKAVFAAFLFHNMMDTSFFYIGITTLMLLLEGTSPDEKSGKRVIGGIKMKIIFGAFAIFFLFQLFRYRNLL